MDNAPIMPKDKKIFEDIAQVIIIAAAGSMIDTWR